LLVALAKAPWAVVRELGWVGVTGDGRTLVNSR
jgi:hypothetical protein